MEKPILHITIHIAIHTTVHTYIYTLSHTNIHTLLHTHIQTTNHTTIHSNIHAIIKIYITIHSTNHTYIHNNMHTTFDKYTIKLTELFRTVYSYYDHFCPGLDSVPSWANVTVQDSNICWIKNRSTFLLTQTMQGVKYKYILPLEESTSLN